MNKELIKKYKEEFDKWLVTGTVWVNLNGWQLLGEDYTWVHTCPHVIDDEYTKFRKALAEGKTIQEDIEDYDDIFATPSWITRHKIDFTNVKGELRIKPEEPEFKVGDWVRYTEGLIGRITRIKIDYIVVFSTSGFCSEPIQDLGFKLWKPKPCEWVVINSPREDRFEVFRWQEGDTLDVQPFIGELPTHLKDK